MGKVKIHGHRNLRQEGIIGCGNIGAIVADRAQGLRMKAMGYDPFLTEERAKKLGIEKVELDELLGRQTSSRSIPR